MVAGDTVQLWVITHSLTQTQPFRCAGEGRHKQWARFKVISRRWTTFTQHTAAIQLEIKGVSALK